MALKYKQLRVNKLGTNFREITEVVEAELPSDLKEDQVVMKTAYVALNASDLNLSNGNYGVVAPFIAGMEALGEILKVGSAVTNVQVGGFAYYFNPSGAFSEYVVGPAALFSPVPAIIPDFLAVFLSGTTASIALERVAKMKTGKTVLVTTAAGGTGQFAVQLAKLAGNQVIGTCGSDAKVQFLKDLGCDRVINYKTEDLNDVLQKEYPKGIDLVYECVGGKTLETIVNNIAVHGKIVLIGMISGYVDQSFTKNQPTGTAGYPTELKLLMKSASMRGFYLGNHMQDIPTHAMKLMGLAAEGKLKVVTDCSFKGIEHIADAVDYLYAGKNTGKVLVDLRK